MKKMSLLIIGAIFVAGCGKSEEPTPEVVAASSRPAYASSTAPAPETKPADIAQGPQPLGKNADPQFAAATQAATQPGASKEVTTYTGLKYVDLKVGTGASPKKGSQVVVHYTGWLTDGTKFDSSRGRNQPFSFAIGQGNVIAGWDEGVMSMKIGGRRILTIPAHLGYGSAGTRGIPGGATLIFDVELLEVK